jgi:PEP-CTERM motif
MQKPQQSCLILIAASLVLAESIPLAHADIIGFGDLSQFTLNQDDSASPATIPSPGSIELTNSGIGEARSLFYDTPQNISHFSASFTYQALTTDNIDNSGAAFVLQNSPAGPHAVGNYSFAYGNLPNSAAITLESMNETGVYTNGIMSGGSASTSPVNLFSGDPVDVALVYDGATLHETLTDLVTSSTFSKTYLINLPSAIGSSIAFVGFTAGTYPLSYGGTGEQIFSNFNVPEPSSVALLGIGTLGIIALGLRSRRLQLRRRPR